MFIIYLSSMIGIVTTGKDHQNISKHISRLLMPNEQIKEIITPIIMDQMHVKSKQCVQYLELSIEGDENLKRVIAIFYLDQHGGWNVTERLYRLNASFDVNNKLLSHQIFDDVNVRDNGAMIPAITDDFFNKFSRPRDTRTQRMNWKIYSNEWDTTWIDQPIIYKSSDIQS